MKFFFTCWAIIFSTGLFAQGEKILNKHLEDYGQNLWDQINSIKVSGKMVTEEYKAYPLSITLKGKEKVRIEGTNENGSFVMASSGFNFWMQGSVMHGTVEPIQKLITQHALTIGSPLKKDKSDLTYSGLEVFENTVYHTFRTSEGSTSIIFYLDKNSYRLRHQIGTFQMGEEIHKVLFTYDKYKLQHGLLSPTAIQMKTNDKFQEWVIDELIIGIGSPDAIFEHSDSP